MADPQLGQTALVPLYFRTYFVPTANETAIDSHGVEFPASVLKSVGFPLCRGANIGFRHSLHWGFHARKHSNCSKASLKKKCWFCNRFKFRLTLSSCQYQQYEIEMAKGSLLNSERWGQRLKSSGKQESWGCMSGSCLIWKVALFEPF